MTMHSPVPDSFSAEQREWLEALRNVFKEYGELGVQKILNDM